MLASVVIAAYNHERFIADCLASVFRQTHPDIELILVDDASADDTFAVANDIAGGPDYRARFRRVEIVRNAANLGAHETWNRAVDMAGGDLIFLLNSDDMFRADRIERFAALDRGDEFFGFSGILPVDDAGRTVNTTFAASLRYQARLAQSKYPFISWGFVEKQISVSTGNFVLSKRLWDSVDGFKNLKYCHDWELAIRLICRIEPVFLHDEMYLYRLHQSNSFSSLSSVAESESETCMRTYLEQCFSRRPGNPHCLSPANFGKLFYASARRSSLEYFLRKLCYPYASHHRTANAGLVDWANRKFE